MQIAAMYLVPTVLGVNAYEITFEAGEVCIPTQEPGNEEKFQ